MNKKTYEVNSVSNEIDYVFERLLLPIIISTQYVVYKEYWEKYEQLLLIVKKWINVYYNTGDLTKIDIKDMNEFDSLITDLKMVCLVLDPRYVEEIDIWHGEFLELWKNSIMN